MIQVVNVSGVDIAYDFDAYTATVDGEVRPVTDQERNIIDNTKQAIVTDAATNVEAQRRSEILSTPIEAPPITGTTVEEVKTSAEAAISDLAAQMEAKIQILLG